MNIGERIKKLREQGGFSQEEVGKVINSSKQTVFKYETGIVTNIPIDKIEKLSQFFHVSPAYIMGWQENQQPTDPKTDGLREALIEMLTSLTPEETRQVIAFVRGLTASRTEPTDPDG